MLQGGWMRIALIHPPDPTFVNTTVIQTDPVPPIGLALLAKAVKRIGTCDVSVLDGNGIPLGDLLQLQADVVGVSSVYTMHGDGLRILEAAKQKGAITLMGGPNTSALAERILRNNPFVDYVVVGDGEESLPALLQGEPPPQIPGLVYRDGDRIMRSPVKPVKLDLLFDLEETVGPTYKREIPFPTASIRGCIKASQIGRCSFCSMEQDLRVMAPKLVWEQIDLLSTEYGYSYFSESGDSFIVGNFPLRLLQARPNTLRDIKFKIYAGPEQINKEIVSILANLGVIEVFLGVESIDQEVLQRAGKACSPEQIRKAVSLLDDAGIRMHVPFIYGLPGETKESMQRSFEFAQGLTSCNGMMFLSSNAIPLAGSELFSMLRSNSHVRQDYPGNLDADDSFDYEKLLELQTHYCTGLDLGLVMEFVQRTRALLPAGRVGRFGTETN